MSYPPQQPGPYGQQPPWGAPPPAYPVGPPPSKPRTGLIAALVIAGILVLGGGGVGLYFLASNDDPSPSGGTTGSTPDDTGDPASVTDRFAALYEEAVNSDLDGFDVADFKPVMCGGDYDKVRTEAERTRKARESAGRKPSKRPPSKRVDIGVKDLKTDGDRGTFTLTWDEPGGRDLDDRQLDLLRDNGDWRVCGLYKKTATSARPSSAPLRPSTLRPSTRRSS